MGADENVAVMRRGYEAFNTGDLDTLTEVFDEAMVWHLPGRSSFAKDYQGRDATLAYFGQLAEKTGGPSRPSCSTCLQTTMTVDWHPAQYRRARRQAPGRWQLHCLPAQERPGYCHGREHFHDLYAWDEFWS